MAKKEMKKNNDDTTATEEASKEASKEAESEGQLGALEWRECGVGTLRLLAPKDDDQLDPAESAANAASAASAASGRLVMRRDKTETVILNASLKVRTLPNN